MDHSSRYLNRPKRSKYSRPRRDLSYEEPDVEEENDDAEDDVQEDDDNPDEFYRRLDETVLFGRFPKRQRSASGLQFTDNVKLGYDWTEDEASLLLEVWGDRFLQLGRRSLRGEDWVDVSEKVSEALKNEKTEAQCRQMIDALKRKYKKEKLKVERSGPNSTKWPFFRKMEMLLGLGSSSIWQQEHGLACGLDSGEFVFMDTQVYLDRSNGFDEMRDSPGESEVDEDVDEDKNGGLRRSLNNEASMMMLADSVQRFGRIYEKIESSKREHMKELVKMRVDFQRELELQKKQILDRAQLEIARISKEEDEEESDEDEDNNDDSSENPSE